MKKVIFIFVALLFFIGCEEVIEVELDNAEPQIVIEANISNIPSNNFVVITKSTDFYNPSEFTNVTDAEVIVTDQDGNTFSFIELTPGRYINQNLSAKIGTEYLMTITTEGVTYSAKSHLPRQIFIDSIVVTGEKRPFDDELDYEYHCYFQDYPNIKDYARFRLIINGENQNGIFRYDDRLTDGNHIDFNRFFLQDERTINIGDIVTIELLTIDKATFEYFDTLRDALATSGGGPFGSTAPSNPTTNWDNDALGYFSAYSIDSKSVIIE